MPHRVSRTGQDRCVDDDARRRLPASARTALERTERLAETLVGQSEADAVEAARSHGITVRIAERDGIRFVLRSDMRFSRITLVIDAGVVTGAVAN